METKIVQCAVCGAEIDLLTQQCPYCNPKTEPDETLPPSQPGPRGLSAAAPTPAPTAAPPTVPVAGVAPAAPQPAAVASQAQPSPPPAPRPAAAAPAVAPSPATPPARAPDAVPPAPRSPVAPTAAGPAAAVAAAALPAPPVPPPAVTEDERALGLALFEAEEAFARGAAEKAVVLASKIVKEHPESLTGRALLDRARRELLRGRRRERLETRVREAQGFFETGDFAGAERIVTSALKLLPDHALALDLFGKLRERRLQAGTAEAEAERELLGLARAQARQALEAARAALAAGWGRKAVEALRRGLRLVPDDPALLELLREAQGSLETLDVERSRRHAQIAQVRAGMDLLAQGRVDESLRILRAVLRQDPDNERAQAAIQEVRRVHLARQSAAPAPAVAMAGATPRLAQAPGLTSETDEAAPAAPEPPPQPIRLQPAPAPPLPATFAARGTPARAERAIPPEILLPRTRRRATPLGLVVGAGLLLSALVLVLAGRGGSSPGRPRPPDTTAATPALTEPAATAPRETLPGPLTSLDPELRQAIDATLTAYAQALEKADASALAGARPDMRPDQREARLLPFVGALNAATDIRVLDASVRGEEALVSILSTDVIVGGRGGTSPPLEETLRFARREGAWTLVSPRGSEPGRRR